LYREDPLAYKRSHICYCPLPALVGRSARCLRPSSSIRRGQIIALPATTLTAGHSRKSFAAAGPPNGSFFTCEQTLHRTYRSSSWIAVVFGLRTKSSATVWCVSQPRHQTSRYGYPAFNASANVAEGCAGPRKPSLRFLQHSHFGGHSPAPS
jgi:hypothetical protein